MAETVHALRNEIRVAVGRFEREVSSGFTKETLAAICAALDCEVAGTRPSKASMRSAIRAAVGTEGGDEPLRKTDLVAVATALRD